MPPKANKKQNPRIKTNTPNSLPIFQMLTSNSSISSTQNSEIIASINSKLQQIYQNNQQSFVRSTMLFVLNLCGCGGKYGVHIDWRHNVQQQIQQLMDVIAEQYKNKNNKVIRKSQSKSKNKSKNNKNKSKNKQKQQQQKQQQKQQQYPQFPLLAALTNNNRVLDQFRHNTQSIFKYIISDDLAAINQTNIMKLLFQVLCVMAKCKLRNVRASVIQVIRIIIARSCTFYTQLITSSGQNSSNNKSQSQQKRTKKLLTIIQQGYLQQIIKNRLKDIDSGIRERAFTIIHTIVNKLSNQMMHDITKLDSIFSPILTIMSSGYQYSPKIIQLSLKMLIQMFEMKKKTKQSLQNLIEYTLKIQPILYDTALLHNNVLSLRCLCKLQVASQTPKLLTAKQILKLFQAYTYSLTENNSHKQSINSNNTSQTLNLCLQIFLYSITSITAKKQLQPFRQNIIVQFVNIMAALLTLISSSTPTATMANKITKLNNPTISYISAHNNKILKQITKSLFTMLNNTNNWILNVQQMFIILISEYYYSQRDAVEVQLREVEVYVLLLMIIQFNIHTNRNLTSSKKDSITYQHCNNQLNSYNRNVLNNCKQIFFDKITKYQQFCCYYLRLFSYLCMPLPQNLVMHADFIIDRVVVNILKEQKFIVMGVEDITDMFNIVKQCIQVYHKMTQSNNTHKLQNLLQILNINSLLEQQQHGKTNSMFQLDPIDIIKVSSLSTFYNVEKLHDYNFLKLCLSTYLHSKQAMLSNASKLQLLTFLSNTHRHMFSQIFNEPSQYAIRRYINYRGQLIDLVTDKIISSSQQSDEYWLVKLGAFGLIMQILRTSGNDCLLQKQIYPLYCELSAKQLHSITKYIEDVLHSQICSMAKIVSSDLHNNQNTSNNDNHGSNSNNNKSTNYQLVIPGFQNYYKQQTSDNMLEVTKLMNSVGLDCVNLKQNVIEEYLSVIACNQKLCIQTTDSLAKLLLIEHISQFQAIKQYIKQAVSSQTTKNSILQTSVQYLQYQKQTGNNNTNNASNNISATRTYNYHQAYQILLKYRSLQQSKSVPSVNTAANTVTVNILLKQLIHKQCQQINKGKFVFWRVYTHIMSALTDWYLTATYSQNHEYEQQQYEYELICNNNNSNIVIDTANVLLHQYFKYKKNPKLLKILNDKMMLYVADAFDRAITDISLLLQVSINNSNKGQNMAQMQLQNKYETENMGMTTDNSNISSNHKKYRQIIMLGLLQVLIKKVYRRYPKQVLYRLSVFFNNKIKCISEFADADAVDGGAMNMDVENGRQQQQQHKHTVHKHSRLDKHILSQIKILKKYLQKISKPQKLVPTKNNDNIMIKTANNNRNKSDDSSESSEDNSNQQQNRSVTDSVDLQQQRQFLQKYNNNKQQMQLDIQQQKQEQVRDNKNTKKRGKNIRNRK